MKYVIPLFSISSGNVIMIITAFARLRLVVYQGEIHDDDKTQGHKKKNPCSDKISAHICYLLFYSFYYYYDRLAFQ